jgi:sugar/nucleoside kinase (ribokinase family)
MGTSLDCASAAPLARLGGLAFLGLTSEVETVLVTLDEAEVLCRTREPERVLEHLITPYHEVVLKLGPEGAMFRSRTHTAIRVPAAAPAGPVVGTAGAGDAFAGGWLAARRSGGDPHAALVAACNCAARAVTSPGARPPPRVAASA